MWYDSVNIEELIGKSFSKVENINGDELVFTSENGQSYKFYHQQDCCESVRIEDITGDLNDLVGVKILMAEESSGGDESTWGSQTWTFYKFGTIKGYVTVRWLGESNGYYSEGVSFVKI